MKAIHLTDYGDPLQNLVLVDIPEPTAPGPTEALIRLEYSPIDPSDLLLARGMYFLRPQTPAVVGGQGIGLVEAIGSAVTSVRVGDRVSLPFGTYAWAELVKAEAKELFVVSPLLDVQQAAMITINPPTAILLLTEFVDLQAGDWVVLNAANSSVANTIIAVAKARGLKTLGIVRRPDAVPAARAAGADVVLVESPSLAEEANQATGGANIKLGLDAVGGEAAGTLVKVLGFDSHLVSYAVLSFQPLVIDGFAFIYKRMKMHGFWLFLPQYLDKLRGAKQETAELMLAGQLDVPIAATYALEQISEAVAHTQRGEKVLLSFKR